MPDQLVLPRKENGFNPPVRSVSIRQRGQQRGVRSVFFNSLMDYLKSCEMDWMNEQADVVEEED